MKREEYETIKKIGSGHYGKIYLVRVNGKEMALKRIESSNDKGMDLSALREIKILRNIDHPYIIRIHDIFSEKNSTLCLLMDYHPFDLKNLIKNKILLSETEVIEIIYQILEAFKYLHTQAIVHRDIKPDNVLISSEGITKLIDFGLARHIQSVTEPLTKYVITQWYKPPEVLYGSEYYGIKVDIWSLGCVFAELLLGKPLFPGYNQTDQLSKIFGIRGTPNIHKWSDIKKLPGYLEFEDRSEIPLKLIFPEVSNETLQILEEMLSLNPNHRPSASALLERDLFKDLQHEKIMLDIGHKIQEHARTYLK